MLRIENFIKTVDSNNDYIISPAELHTLLVRVHPAQTRSRTIDGSAAAMATLTLRAQGGRTSRRRRPFSWVT